MANPIVDFFRCPAWFADSELRVRVSDELRSAVDEVLANDPVWQERSEHWLSSVACEELIEMLRREHYQAASTDTTLGAILLRELYYGIRPFLGVALRRHLQRFFLRGWDSRPFPKWPVDRTVDKLHETLLAAALRIKCVERVPFIWFWPNGHSSCALMTHDVETATGLQFCPTLMDMDDAAGIKSSFQLIPEQRYTVTPAVLHAIRSRGFEINVHDLNHDGHLFRDREQFLHRVQRINDYGKKFGASGFRSGALYRNQDWYESLDFSFDMSVPNVAHLDPQHGGCCTVFPYFIGEILELPVTAIQDYSLFHVLGKYSIDIWQTQVSEIVEHHGLISIIAHPDYLIEQQARQTYLRLLDYMNELRLKEGVWIPQPSEVDRWWRQRSEMTLVWQGTCWSIVGQGHERASIAYAELRDGKLVYRLGNGLSPESTTPPRDGLGMAPA